MIERSIEQQIRQFLLTDKRALLVTGPRQVGKTFSIRKVGKECFKNFVEINFIEQPQAVDIFKNSTDADDLILRISALTRKKLSIGDTLLFLDEVQECLDVVTAIKFLIDKTCFRFILSGSLLGVELKDVRSVPVGYIHELEMHPLDMKEFFLAIGISDDILNNLKQRYDKLEPVDEYLHKRMIEAVRLYSIIGGMPAVVQQYLNTNNLRDVSNQQLSIIRAYKRDISKYASLDKKLHIEEVYDLIPAELNAKNKRFIIKDIHDTARFSKFEDSFVWLKEAGVAIPVYNVEEPKMPLLLNKQRNLFKLFANDIGLLTSMYGPALQLKLLANDVNVNYGAIYENIVAQELTAHGFSNNNSLFYFNSKKQGELDFVVEMDGEIIPIEVKSGKDYARHIALANVIMNENYDINRAIVLCQDNISIKGVVTYLPIYMLMFFEPRQMESTIVRFDAFPTIPENNLT